MNTDCLDGLSTISSDTFDAIVTSPPYFAPPYHEQEGLGATEIEYLKNLSIRLLAAMRTLKHSGVMFLNLGEIVPNRTPWKTVGLLVDGGFKYFGEYIWRQDETHHESIYVLGKSPFSGMISGVWDLGLDSKTLRFPETLVENCLKRFQNVGYVLDPFAGFGTTGVVARRLGWDFLGFEKKADTCAAANSRILSV